MCRTALGLWLGHPTPRAAGFSDKFTLWPNHSRASTRHGNLPLCSPLSKPTICLAMSWLSLLSQSVIAQSASPSCPRPSRTPSSSPAQTNLLGSTFPLAASWAGRTLQHGVSASMASSFSTGQCPPSIQPIRIHSPLTPPLHSAGDARQSRASRSTSPTSTHSALPASLYGNLSTPITHQQWKRAPRCRATAD